MLATLALVTALSGTDPTSPVLVAPAHAPSQTQAQVERAASVERARTEHAERLRAAAEIARVRMEMSAAVRAQAKAQQPAVDGEALRLARASGAGVERLRLPRPDATTKPRS